MPLRMGENIGTVSRMIETLSISIPRIIQTAIIMQ